jgi:hypothetical protein
MSDEAAHRIASFLADHEVIPGPERSAELMSVGRRSTVNKEVEE